MTDTPKGQTRSLGRKTIRVSLTPRELITPTPELKNVWKATVITLFPTAFPGVLGESLIGKALHDGLWQLSTIDLRRFGMVNVEMRSPSGEKLQIIHRNQLKDCMGGKT